MKVDDVRTLLRQKLFNKEFVTDKTGVNTVEIAPASFLADEDAIFGEVNWDYVNREIEWYDSQSLLVKDIPGETPAIWNSVSSQYGSINSNYGWCIYSPDNYHQYESALLTLEKDLDSRRAIMIYTRPSMQREYNSFGMSDFMCTDAVQYMYRDGALNAYVRMRSNDAVFGYKNDRAWQDVVLTRLSNDLGVKKGVIYWYAASLHVYERHFNLM